VARDIFLRVVSSRNLSLSSRALVKPHLAPPGSINSKMSDFRQSLMRSQKPLFSLNFSFILISCRSSSGLTASRVW